MENLNITLHITEKCNLKCKYCYITAKNKSMDWEIAKQAINFVSSLSNKSIILSLTTAEPLLEWALIKRIIEYAEGRGVKRFDLATNGVLLNKNILKYLTKHNVVLQLSFDGRQPEHDSFRFFRNNQKTSQVLDEKLNLIKEHYNNNIEIRVTFVPKTVKYLADTVSYLVEKKFCSKMRINLVPVVQCRWREVDFRVLSEQLFIIADLFIKSYWDGKPINICSSECIPKQYHLLNIYKYRDSEEMFCNVGHEIISIGPDGKIWPCYWLGASKFRQKNKLCLGQLNNKEINYYKARQLIFPKRSPFLSCRVWNYLLNGDSMEPVYVYKQNYKIWYNVSKYVNQEIYKND